MRYRLNRIALEELISAAQYYESCQIGLGRRFLDQVYKSINTILDAPNRWPNWNQVGADTDSMTSLMG